MKNYYELQRDKVLCNNEDLLVEIISYLPPDESRAALLAVFPPNNHPSQTKVDSILELASEAALIGLMKTAENYWNHCWKAVDFPAAVDEDLVIWANESRSTDNMDKALLNLEMLVDNDSSLLGDILRLTRNTARTQDRFYGRPSTEYIGNVLVKEGDETWHSLYTFVYGILIFTLMCKKSEENPTSTESGVEMILGKDAKNDRAIVIYSQKEFLALTLWFVFGSPSLPMTIMNLDRVRQLTQLAGCFDDGQHNSSELSDSRYFQIAGRFKTLGLVFQCVHPELRSKMEANGLLLDQTDGSIQAAFPQENLFADGIFVHVASGYQKLVKSLVPYTQRAIEDLDANERNELDGMIEKLIHRGVQYLLMWVGGELYRSTPRERHILFHFDLFLDFAHLLSLYRDGSFHHFTSLLEQLKLAIQQIEGLDDITYLPIAEHYSNVANWLEQVNESS